MRKSPELMRPLLLLFVATGCGRVVVNALPNPDARAVPVDATELPPDAAPGTCPQHIADPMPPQWFARADFDVVNDPAGTKGQVWKANGSSPSGSFVVQFQDGDRLDGLAFEAYGDGSPGGLKNIQVLYQPDASVPQQAIATGDDLGRGPKWGAVTFPNLQPTVLSSNGAVTVLFDVIGTGYYIGQVTPALERPCKP